jgi:2-C-methyl-D-erythritol 4-phosphate cytidylyltransferase
MNTASVILASGSGLRFDAKDTPKHLTLILGIPIIVWTIDTVIRSKLFTSIVIVTREADITKTKNIIGKYFPDNFDLITITSGSSVRIQSFFLGLDNLIKDNLLENKSIIGLFDANRPFTPIKQLKELYERALEVGCSCPVRPVVNGIAEINQKKIMKVPEKMKYVEYVTPEFIKFDIINDYLQNNENILSSLVEYALKSGVKPAICDASVLNAKLTFPEDKTYLEGLAVDHDIHNSLKQNL